MQRIIRDMISYNINSCVGGGGAYSLYSCLHYFILSYTSLSRSTQFAFEIQAMDLRFRGVDEHPDVSSDYVVMVYDHGSMPSCCILS